MILIAGTLTFPLGGIEKSQDSMREVIDATRREDGCISYDFAVDVSNPDRLVIFELWRDRSALERHLDSPHIAVWRQAAAAAGPTERDLSVWEVGEGRTL